MLLTLWLLFGFVNACYVRSQLGPMRVSRWVALTILGPYPATLAFVDWLNINVLDRRI